MYRYKILNLDTNKNNKEAYKQFESIKDMHLFTFSSLQNLQKNAKKAQNLLKNAKKVQNLQEKAKKVQNLQENAEIILNLHRKIKKDNLNLDVEFSQVILLKHL
jgi:multidrug resistance efflux pump